MHEALCVVCFQQPQLLLPQLLPQLPPQPQLPQPPQPNRMMMTIKIQRQQLPPKPLLLHITEPPMKIKTTRMAVSTHSMAESKKV